jgi:hypothetical protein
VPEWLQDMPVGVLIICLRGGAACCATKIVQGGVIGGRLREQSTSGAIMRVVLVLVALGLVVLLWRAFVFDRKHRGQLRSASDIARDAKRHRDEQATGSDPSSGLGAGPM